MKKLIFITMTILYTNAWAMNTTTVAPVFDADQTQELLNAIQTGNFKLAQQAITNNADVNAVTHDGATMLHLAVKLQSPEIVNLLLAKHADPNKKHTKNGRTPLYNAAILLHDPYKQPYTPPCYAQQQDVKAIITSLLLVNAEIPELSRDQMILLDDVAHEINDQQYRAYSRGKISQIDLLRLPSFKFRDQQEERQVQQQKLEQEQKRIKQLEQRKQELEEMLDFATFFI